MQSPLTRIEHQNQEIWFDAESLRGVVTMAQDAFIPLQGIYDDLGQLRWIGGMAAVQHAEAMIWLEFGIR
jgi:hypothetical protein